MKYKDFVSRRLENIEELSKNAANNISKGTMRAKDVMNILKDIQMKAKQASQKVDLERDDFSRT